MTLPPIPVRKPVERKPRACAQHPRYEASRPPRKGCPVCWGAYLEKHYDLKIKDVLAPQTIHVSDLNDLGLFLIAAKAAAAKARVTGGTYAAFVTDSKTGRRVQVEVAASLRRKD